MTKLLDLAEIPHKSAMFVQRLNVAVANIYLALLYLIFNAVMPVLHRSFLQHDCTANLSVLVETEIDSTIPLVLKAFLGRNADLQ